MFKKNSQSFFLNEYLNASNISKLKTIEIKISNEKASQFDLENLIIMVDEEGDLSIKSKSKRKKHISNHFKWIDAAVAMKCHSVRIDLFGVNNPDAWKEYSKVQPADPALRRVYKAMS